jgi:hypothetical protein
MSLKLYDPEPRAKSRTPENVRLRRSLLKSLKLQLELIDKHIKGEKVEKTRTNRKGETVNYSPKQWFIQRSADGLWEFEIRRGQKPVPLNDKGQFTVGHVKDLKELIPVIKAAVKEIETGEYDKWIVGALKRERKAKAVPTTVSNSRQTGGVEARPAA